MISRGSSRKGNNPGFKTGPRSKATGRSPAPILGNSSSLHSDILREFHETGIYGHAEDIGLIRNGELSHLGNGSSGGHDFSRSAVEGREIHGGMQFPLPGVGPSVSMDSGSLGSPSQGTEATIGTPGANGISLRLQHPESTVEEPESPDVVGRKKKRGQRATTGEKGGKGLRHFSMKVCEKVESKGRTTYNEVADELVAEFTNPENALISPDQQQYDEKNIRRRVYDALNVLMAMEIISKEKKEIQWKGLPSTKSTNSEALKAEKMRLSGLLEKKGAYLQELEEQIVGLQSLVDRNERMFHLKGHVPAGGVALPFILVQTRPQATVEVEISEDMQLVHFDFNSTPFELHDDAFVLKAMSFSENNQNNSESRDGPFTDSEEGFDPTYDDHSSPVSNLYHRPSIMSMSPRSAPPYSVSTSPPPVPSILKARVKHENYN
ncbi:hypothetical protein R1flu_005705 [Riccia fluitans]|uniref:Transcription factor-like protein DPB n=1 Tax=Riccia fluitans TaxID=41844 RepID=A0ABD1YTX9_9MARC